jgi:hypothetical protein
MAKRYIFTEEQCVYILDQYTQKMISVNKIAVAVGVSSPTVIRFLREEGVKVSNAAEDKRKRYAKTLPPIPIESAENRFIVYFHRLKKDDTIFYVGKGTGDRPYRKDNRGKDWYSFTDNNEYYVEIYKKDLTENEALIIEREQILQLEGLVNKNICYPLELNQLECSEHFEYCESSPSCLNRIKGKWTGTYNKGSLGAAGYLSFNKRTSKKYWRIKFNAKSLMVHRLIWILINGNIPDNCVIDHIDGDSTNNRIENLRCISQKINCLNKTKSKSNTSGETGIFLFNEQGARGYRAIIKFNGRQLSQRYYFHKLGEEEAFRSACEWRKERIAELNAQGAGYTERHGT